MEGKLAETEQFQAEGKPVYQSLELTSLNTRSSPVQNRSAKTAKTRSTSTGPTKGRTNLWIP